MILHVYFACQAHCSVHLISPVLTPIKLATAHRKKKFWQVQDPNGDGDLDASDAVPASRPATPGIPAGEFTYRAFTQSFFALACCIPAPMPPLTVGGPAASPGAFARLEAVRDVLANMFVGKNRPQLNILCLGYNLTAQVNNAFVGLAAAPVDMIVGFATLSWAAKLTRLNIIALPGAPIAH